MDRKWALLNFPFFQAEYSQVNLNFFEVGITARSPFGGVKTLYLKPLCLFLLVVGNLQALVMPGYH